MRKEIDMAGGFRANRPPSIFQPKHILSGQRINNETMLFHHLKVLILIISFAVMVTWHTVAGFPQIYDINQFPNSLNTNEWGSPVNDIQLGIVFADGNSQIRTNQPFSLTVRIKNLSTNSQYCINLLNSATVNSNSFLVTIISPSGKNISPVASPILSFSGGFVCVSPLHILEYEFKLSDICRLNEFGTYKITAQRNVDASLRKKVWAVSNPLIVTVVPGEWKPEMPQSNQFYVPDDLLLRGSKTTAFSFEQIEAAKRAKDSRPAEDDPEGNWGTVSEGFQLSIRLEKNSFTNGEPISAYMILRNVSDKALRFPVSYGNDPETKLTLKKGETALLTHDEALSIPRTDSFSLQPMPAGIQCKYTLDLSTIFDLKTNGTYSIQATKKIPNMDQTKRASVDSGTAVFQITAP
jgi:hypothetical protein